MGEEGLDEASALDDINEGKLVTCPERTVL